MVNVWGWVILNDIHVGKKKSKEQFKVYTYFIPIVSIIKFYQKNQNNAREQYIR